MLRRTLRFSRTIDGYTVRDQSLTLDRGEELASIGDNLRFLHV